VDRDLRGSAVWTEVEDFYQRLHSPAFGQVSGAVGLHPHPSGQSATFTGTVIDKLEGVPHGHLCSVDLQTGVISDVTAGTSEDNFPRWSPDGTALAFLSDRAAAGIAQVYVLETGTVADARPVGALDGTVEYFAWSPDASRLLIGLAGLGADRAGGQGSGVNISTGTDLPPWVPQVEEAVRSESWRTLWIWDRATGSIQRLSRPGVTIWEACWAGPTAIAAVVTDQPGEDAWYKARLIVVDAATGETRPLLASEVQMGVPSCSPSGSEVAVIEAFSSDRQVLAGDLVVVDVATGDRRTLDTLGVDVTFHVWRDDDTLFFIGQRGLDTVAGDLLVRENKATELWASQETCGGRYPEAWPLPDGGMCLIAESWDRYPEIATVRGGALKTVASLDHEGGRWLRSQVGEAKAVSWSAPDGLEIQGLLLLPKGPGPYPLVVHVHGGPVWAWRNKWVLQFHAPIAFLVAKGYAVLNPNPRGSSGRGQEFARMVLGGMGDDVGDFLSGVDHLVAEGIADTARVGVTGGSYGGFMSSWLVTQTERFAAAIPMAPVTDWQSQHFTSNIGFFDALFLDDDPARLGGQYWDRSPLTFAAKVTTPTLHIAGLEDRCTPPTQAVEFHRALVEHGRAPTEVVLYPGEGHGVRQFPAALDVAVRVLTWFRRYMPAPEAPAEAGSE